MKQSDKQTSLSRYLTKGGQLPQEQQVKPKTTLKPVDNKNSATRKSHQRVINLRSGDFWTS